MHIRTMLILWSATALLRAQAPALITGQIDAAKAMQFLYHNYDAKTQSSSRIGSSMDRALSIGYMKCLSKQMCARDGTPVSSARLHRDAPRRIIVFPLIIRVTHATEV
jgi:hypothetical protein